METSRNKYVPVHTRKRGDRIIFMKQTEKSDWRPSRLLRIVLQETCLKDVEIDSWACWILPR
jgi:hypothetical protein